MKYINLVGNRKALETLNRIKKIGTDEFGLEFIEDSKNFKDEYPTLYYGISNFNLSKKAQAEYFEDILPNTIISPENYEVIKDYDLIIMKNPTRLLLWKDAKRETGTKYLYIKDRDEWRINYSYGKVRGVFNKNIRSNVFGKADITQWVSETDNDVRKFLIDITKQIAEKLEADNYNLKSFGLDIIRDNRTGEFLFLELNQANSLGEQQVRFFLKGYIDYIQSYEKFISIKNLLSECSVEELISIRDEISNMIDR